MTKHVKDILPKILPAPDSWKLIILQNWEIIMGDLKRYVFLEKIQEDNTLVLGVTNTSWLQELYYLSDVLIKKINTKLEYPHVTQLRFKYSPRKKNIQPKKFNKSTDTVHKQILLTTLQKKALETIKDQQLQEALKNFLIRCSDQT